MKVKTRFAPSPTGYMHVGNFRTALYSYLIAKKHKGSFVFRLEDTDKAREVKGSLESIYRSLKWAGLVHDEGPDIGGPNEPYKQSDRLVIYKSHINDLIDKGHAYHCFCSPGRLDSMRKEQQARGEMVKYDRHCCNLESSEIEKKIEAGESYVIRQKINSSGTTKFTDLVRGEIEIENITLDDSILIKSDGFPAYNFANVVDDHLMEITHIIRGEEFIPSTPKYIQLYNAFGWEVPAHAHLSLILNKNKSKLSKRDGSVTLEDYVKQGYLPETIINFVALLGWNPGDDREIFSLEELVNEFDFDKVNKSGAVFDTEKLDWMNGHYIRAKKIDELTELCLPYFDSAITDKFDKEFIESVVGLEQERLKKLSDIGDKTKYFFETPKVDQKMIVWKKSDEATTKERIKFLIDYLSEVPNENWTRNSLEKSLIEKIKQEGLNNGEVLWPMRVALSGQEKSPSPFEIAEVLGKEETLNRLKSSIN
jgi:glutamyl-tRNA synthetase